MEGKDEFAKFNSIFQEGDGEKSKKETVFENTPLSKFQNINAPWYQPGNHSVIPEVVSEVKPLSIEENVFVPIKQPISPISETESQRDNENLIQNEGKILKVSKVKFIFYYIKKFASFIRSNYGKSSFNESGQSITDNQVNEKITQLKKSYSENLNILRVFLKPINLLVLVLVVFLVYQHFSPKSDMLIKQNATVDAYPSAAIINSYQDLEKFITESNDYENFTSNGSLKVVKSKNYVILTDDSTGFCYYAGVVEKSLTPPTLDTTSAKCH